MTTHTVVCLFPGQGAFYQGVGTDLQLHAPRFKDITAIIEEEANRLLGVTISPALFSATPPSAEQLLMEGPEQLQLVIYAIAVTVYKELEERGAGIDMLCGHSFGELAALVCGGAFSIRQGAELVCHRLTALKELQGDRGFMAAFGIGTGRARDLVRLAGEERCAVAVENHDSQTVLSGTTEAMDVLVKIAEILNIPVKRLVSAYAFHCPAVMKTVAERFAVLTRHIHGNPLQTPVYSPILGREYNDEDDLTECLAEHLYKPVRFSEAVLHMYTGGSRLFIECGALKTLTTLVKTGLKDPTATVIPMLDPARNGESFSLAMQMLEAAGVVPEESGKNLREYILPGVPPASFDVFWRAHGPEFIKKIRARYELEQRENESRAGQPAGEACRAEREQEQRSGQSRKQIYNELRELYAAVLEYPSEVFEEQIDLEAELGVDSVKQMELLSRIQDRYGIPPLPEDFRLSEYNTLGKVTDLVMRALQVSHE